MKRLRKKKVSFGIRLCVPLLLVMLFSSLVVLPSASGATDYRSLDLLMSDFYALEAAYPTLVTHEIIGQSVDGKDIMMFKIGTPEGGRLLIDGAIHGNEHASSETLYYMMEWLLQQDETSSQQIIQNNYLLIVPALNVDSYGNSRYNAHEVDLNRNYETGWGDFNDWYRGEYPLSEPEAQAIHQVFLTYQPDWYLNLHTGDSRISPPWAYLDYVPDQAYYEEVYEKIEAESQNRGTTPISYIESGGYAGGTARDEGCSQDAYTFLVELYWDLQPTYSYIELYLVPRLIPVVITTSQECSTTQPPTPTPTPTPSPTPTPEPTPEPTIEYTLTIKSGAGGETSPPAGTYVYDEGETVTVSAIPDNNYEFSYWLLDGLKISDNPITIMMDSNHLLRPRFTRIGKK